MEKSWQYKAFIWAVRRSQIIKPVFYLIYFFISAVWIYAAYFYFFQKDLGEEFYSVGVNFGRVALIILGIVVLPGILGRFRLEIPITRIITNYRRQFGILVFSLAFTHFSIVKLFPVSIKISPLLIPPPSFELFGFLALSIMFLLFLTSNNFSVRTFKKWWKRLHRFIYLILWLLVLHTGLQRISLWSIFIFAFATLEVVSWIYHFLISPKEE